MKQEALTVTGMTCGGCENAVKQTLLRMPGVSDAKASRTAQRVEVTFDPAKVDLKTLAAKIEELGYHVAA